MASSSANIEPQNERGHVHKFVPLPQSETETHDVITDNHEDQPLSISVESTTTRPTNNIPDYYHYNSASHEFFSLSARACEMCQDLLGVTVLIMLIFLPFYLRFRSPNEDPIPPIFTLNSMYISNFTTGKEGLGATWNAKFTVMNTNVSSISFRKVDFTIFYKENTEDVLSSTSSYPFYLDQGEYVKLHLRFTTTGLEDNPLFVENNLVEEIGKDREKDGSLSFGMQMKVKAIYYGEAWICDVVMNPHCEDLRVQFLPSKDSGKLAKPNRNFSVPIEWKPYTLF